MKMKKWLMLTGVMIVLNFPGPVVLARDRCVDCHGKQNPTLVKDWNNSAMAASGMACADCHGQGHTGSDDIDKAVRPAIHACKKCHEQQAEGFAMGKHGRAEEALAMAPMGKKIKAQAPEVFERSCAACHNGICRDGGQCDACHTGHRFSAKEARKPEACLPCHMGNHPQYEAYSNSKHGALYKSRGLDDTVPTCTTCHMSGGDHGVKTSWGFMGMRGQEPDVKKRADQKVVMEALEMLGPVLAPDSFRPDMAQWETKRTEMVEICAGCHTATFAKEQLKAGDRIVDQANHTAAGFINLAKKMKQSNQCSQEEYFWLIRDKMHAQRMSMYVDAFHQFPEGILLELIHFKRETLDLKKKISAGEKNKEKNNE
jgi:hypothetical protein